jgi:putative endonuclease
MWGFSYLNKSHLEKFCKMLYYIYILQSEKDQYYYVGYSDHPEERTVEHNTNLHSTYTSKHRPWVLKAVFQVGESESTAINLERLIKAQKSRKLLEKLIKTDFVPTGKLAQLVRVPHVRH